MRKYSEAGLNLKAYLISSTGGTEAGVQVIE
jgi:hypothetical protein